MSRWAAGITAGFLAVLWPGVVVFSLVAECAGDCKHVHGREIVVGGVVALILAPVAALLFMLARRVLANQWAASKSLARALTVVAAAVLLAAMTVWASAAGALIEGRSGPAMIANAFVLALVMAVYCAAVAGGSWMSAIGVRRLRGDD